MTSAHSDAEATVESVAPVIEEGPKGQGDGQWGHLLLQHSAHAPVTVDHACGEGNADSVASRAGRKGPQKEGEASCPLPAPAPSAPLLRTSNIASVTLTSKHHVGLGQGQMVAKGKGCVL